MDVEQQPKGYDCGVYAYACATGINPCCTRFHQHAGGKECSAEMLRLKIFDSILTGHVTF